MRIWLAVAAAAAASCGGGDVGRGLAPMARDVLAETNGVRAMGATCEAYVPEDPAQRVELFAVRRAYPAGAGALLADAELAASAQAHAEHMARTGDYAHQSHAAIAAAGGQSENIAFVGPVTIYGPDGAQATRPEPDAEVGGRLVAQWVASPGHCHNLLQPAWRRIGIGVAESAAGRHYGVQVFGR